MNRCYILQLTDAAMTRLEENLKHLPATAPNAAHEIMAAMEALNLASKIYERYEINE